MPFKTKLYCIYVIVWNYYDKKMLTYTANIIILSIIFYSVLTERNGNGPRGYCKMYSEIFVNVRCHF